MVIHKENSIVQINELILNEYYCIQHEQLKYLCTECEVLICGECLISLHNIHKKIKLNESKEKLSEINKKNVITLEKKIINIKKDIKYIDEKEKELENKILKYKNEKNENLFNLFNLQKIINIKNISEENPIQFLLNFNNIVKSYEKFVIEKVFCFGRNER
jgi:hypothetical protein